jgi:proteic killer suppression protein
VIVSFADSNTEKLANLQRVKQFANIERVALRKLMQLDIAENLADLKIPPGNRLEALHGDREGQYSIRINDQFRICFVWVKGNVADVEIVDYH